MSEKKGVHCGQDKSFCGLFVMPPAFDLDGFKKRFNVTEKEALYLTEDCLNEHAEAFAIFDEDKSGSINVEEVKRLLQRKYTNLSTEDASLMVKSVDVDNDNEVSFEEFVLMMLKAQDPSSEILEAFRAFDTDGNGFIEATELQEAMKRGGASISDEEAKTMIAQADLDKDGRISFPEFQEMLRAKLEKHA